ncbi:MAG: ATP-dependent 6-phosphofructokinase [Chloroflexota bacterium]|jgi:ATP-dependent phosphofructokinase / diphosphate-dependent phosphofructokinase
MSKRIAIVTGGGDSPGLNAVIRAAVKAAALRGWESIGILGGYEGLLEPVKTMPLDYRELGSLLYRGGTILGTSNRGSFTAKTGHGQTRRVPQEILEEAKRNFDWLGLDALIAIGGDGSLTIAQQLYETGIPLVGLPKTIDNDIEATLMTFGFETAVTCAVDALDRLHSTAESHNRAMVLEVMGRYAGWIAAYAGLAGGADVILIPEIPFTYEAVAAKVLDRETEGKMFTIIIVSEGAKPVGGDYVTTEAPVKDREARLGGIGHVVAAEVERRTGKESRAVVLGHLQRGGPPTQWDRHLCTRFGVQAVEMIAAGQFGMMAALTAAGMAPVLLLDAISHIRLVPPDSDLVQSARAMGVSFGD